MSREDTVDSRYLEHPLSRTSLYLEQKLRSWNILLIPFTLLYFFRTKQSLHCSNQLDIKRFYYNVEYNTYLQCYRQCCFFVVVFLYIRENKNYKNTP